VNNPRSSPPGAEQQPMELFYHVQIVKASSFWILVKYTKKGVALRV
jgi:hypothetical protein